ncbi:RNF26 ligase, partial [Cnemophilus loriae]|nr:RNF26 ligase [Cnemophilus loriae]
LRRGLRLLRDLLLLLLDLNFLLCSWLVSALLWLLLAAAVAGGDALALLRGCCAGTEGLSGLSAPAQSGLGAGLRCGQALGVGTRLLVDLGRVCLAGTRSLFTLLAALWDSLAGSVLRVSEVLAVFLPHVAGRATAVSIQLWPRCQLAFKLLSSATVVFMSIYFLVYSLAVVCHRGAQNLGTRFVTLWDSLAGLIFGVTDPLAAFLAHVSSGAIAMSMLLWLPFQLALKLLSFATWVFTSLFFIGVYILGILLRIVFLIAFFIVIYCNQELLWMLKEHLLGYSRRQQPVLWRLYHVAVLSLRRATTSQPWRRLVHGVLQVANWRRAGGMRNRGRDQLDAEQGPQPRPALSRSGTGQCHQALRKEPGTSGRTAVRRQQLNATAGSAEGTSGNNPWVLLKEQEERKKCVICQDQTKTVLLLPCRHLCLCQECTEVLLQQDIYQRNCPLCRQVILQTLNVYL